MTVTDLMRVAQYVKSDRDAPSDVYNAACRLLNNRTSAQAATDHLLERAVSLAREVGRTEARAAQLEYERDTLQAQVARLRTAEIEREAVKKATQSNRDTQTPQTLGTAGQDEAREAQKAPQWLTDLTNASRSAYLAKHPQDRKLSDTDEGSQ